MSIREYKCHRIYILCKNGKRIVSIFMFSFRILFFKVLESKNQNSEFLTHFFMRESQPGIILTFCLSLSVCLLFTGLWTYIFFFRHEKECICRCQFRFYFVLADIRRHEKEFCFDTFEWILLCLHVHDVHRWCKWAYACECMSICWYYTRKKRASVYMCMQRFRSKNICLLHHIKFLHRSISAIGNSC